MTTHSGKQVFVTGATGFVGSYLVRYLLQQGHQVTALRRRHSRMDLVADVSNQVRWLEGDVLDVPFLESALEGIEQVYHAAAMISFYPKEFDRMQKVNVEGTANVVNACLHMGVKKLVYISSIAALGRKEFQPDITEKTQWENSKENSNYAISKFRAECEVWRGLQEGLSMVVLNPSVIIGAGYWDQGSCRLFARAAKGMEYYSPGHTGFVDVRDVARAAVLLMESDIEGERYIINGANWSYQQFFSTIAKAVGQAAPSKVAPGWLVGLLWRLEWLRSKLLRKRPLLTQETARTAQATFRYHSDKLLDTLDFEYTSLEQCIQETATAFKSGKTQGFGVLPLV